MKKIDRSRCKPLCDADPALTRMDLYEDPSVAHRELGLWVNAVGFHRGRVAPGLVAGRSLSSYGGVWISGGSGWFESEHCVRQNADPGTMIWLFPGERHSYATGTGTWVEQWVLFGGAQAEAFERSGFLSRQRPLIRLGADPEVRTLFTRLEETFIRSSPLAVPLAAAVTAQLIVTVHGLSSGLLREPGDVEPVSAQAIRIIRHEAIRGLDPSSLAERLHTGYSTLRRRFKLETGYTVKEYILGEKLNYAKQLLALTPQPIERVAAAAGFEDPFHFSKQFRARERMSPRDFRKLHARGTAFSPQRRKDAKNSEKR
jgi:AraC-like DNA-binding protein